jgi:hypothetical protein
MPWLRSDDKDVCPLYLVPVESNGDKWSAMAMPCYFLHPCPFLSQQYAGRYRASVRCKYKKWDNELDEEERRKNILSAMRANHMKLEERPKECFVQNEDDCWRCQVVKVGKCPKGYVKK